MPFLSAAFVSPPVYSWAISSSHKNPVILSTKGPHRLTSYSRPLSPYPNWKFQSSSLTFPWRYPATRLSSTQSQTNLLSLLPHKAFPRGSSLISQHPASLQADHYIQQEPVHLSPVEQTYIIYIKRSLFLLICQTTKTRIQALRIFLLSSGFNQESLTSISEAA